MGMATKIVPIEEVRSFQARIDPPLPDESLLGFVTRGLSISPTKRLVQGLALAGVDAGAPGAIATTLTGEREIKSVARLFRTVPDEIRRRTYRYLPGNHSRSEVIDFFGTGIRLYYREAKIRRVSPRALKLAPYHRAIWELRPFSFDPATKEILLDFCPVCGRNLGWRRAQGPTMCDRCVGENGMPNVDLRDFPQPLVEIEDEVALEFVSDLVDPDPERKAAARRLLPVRWLEFTNGDVFETIMAFASGITMDQAKSRQAQGRAKNIEHFARITPEILALAGRAIIGGEAGFSLLADRYRLAADKRPGFFGRRKEIGPLAHVPYDRDVEPNIRKLVFEMIDTEMTRSDLVGKRKVRRRAAERIAARAVSVIDNGYKNINELSEQFGMRRYWFTRLAKSGLVDVVRASNARRSPVLMAVAEVLPLVVLLPDTMVPRRAADLIGIPIHALAALAERKLIERLEGPILGFMPNKDGYKRSSVEKLVSRIRQLARKPVPTLATRMSRAVRALDRSAAPWDAIISAIVEDDLKVYAYPAKRIKVRSGLAVEDIHSFVEIVAKHVRKRDAFDELEWIDANTTSEILKVTEAFVYRLADRCPDLLKRKRNGRAPFLLADVQVIAKEYIFLPEICERGGMSARRMLRLLREKGLQLPINLQENRDFGFRRYEVEEFLIEQETLRKERLAKLEEAPDNERTRLIRAVESGTPIRVAAKNIGMSRIQAASCIERWRKTGDWKLGKIGGSSPLDQHAEWLKRLIAKDPRISLHGICKALKEKRQVSTNDGSLLKWLDRHNIALARRRRPPPSKGTPLMVVE